MTIMYPTFINRDIRLEIGSSMCTVLFFDILKREYTQKKMVYDRVLYPIRRRQKIP